MIRRAAVPAVAALWGMVGTLGAQGPGTDGPAVTRITPSVRSAAMAGAGAALVGDAGAIFANPAAVATIGAIGLEAAYQHLQLGAQVASGALAFEVGQFHLGVGLQALDYGKEPVVVGGVETGQSFRPWEGVGVGALIYRRGLLAAGGAVKYVRQSLGDIANDGYAGDLGVELAVFDIMAFGLAVQNLFGGDLGAAGELPATTRLGYTLNYVDPQGTLRFLSTIEGLWAQGRKGRFIIGLEGGFIVYGVGVEVRGGYRSAGVSEDLGQLTVGGGVRIGGFTVDYAYQDADLLGAPAHRFGIRWAP